MLLVIIVNTKHMPITVNYDIDLVFVGQSTTQPAHSHPNFCSSIYTDLQRESRYGVQLFTNIDSIWGDWIRRNPSGLYSSMHDSCDL